jgi:uncharacterized membrane protein YbhN (UPF0104 family)
VEQASSRGDASRRLLWLRLAVSLVLLLLVFQRIEDPGRTFEHMRSARLGFVALVIALGLLDLVYGAFKWLVLLRCKLPHLPFGPVVKVQFLSSFLGQFLPGGGTDLVKIYGLARATRDLAFSFTSLLMDRLIGMLPLLLVVLVGLALETKVYLPGLQYLAVAALVAVAVGGVAVMNPRFRRLTDDILRPGGADRLRMRLEEVAGFTNSYQEQPGRTAAAVFSLGFSLVLEIIRDKLQKVYACLDTFRGRPGILAFAVVLGIGINLLRVAVVMAAAFALSIHITWAALLFIVPCVVFVMLLPISLAGWGVRELGLVWFLELYGIPGEQALALSLLLGLVAVIVSLPGAPLFVAGLHQIRVDVAKESGEPLERV